MDINKIIENGGLALLLSIFAKSAIFKILDYDGLVNTIEKKNIPFSKLAAPMSILMLLYGVISILLYKFRKVEKKYAIIGFDMLILFTLLATYYFHNIFVDKGQKINFEKNLAIIGALMYIRQNI